MLVPTEPVVSGIIICCRTFRKDCEASISLSASEDGTSLVVNEFNDHHNHEISQVG